MEPGFRQVFIGGCPRSGTTLLGAMLGQHPRCICVPESQFKVDVLHHDDGQDGAAAWNVIRNHWRFRLWELDPDAIDRHAVAGAFTAAELLQHLVECFAGGRGKVEARNWIDHTPNNLRYADRLARLFPEARFVHLVRDGRGVAASVIPLDWGPNTVISAAAWWTEKIAYGLAAEGRFPPTRIRRLRYEDLLADPAATLQELCRFLALEYDSRMTVTKSNVVPRYSAGQHQLVGEPVDPTRSDAWESSLTRRDIELFETYTGDLLPCLGYEPRYGSVARLPGKLERFGYALTDVTRATTNRLVHRRLRRRRALRSRVGEASRT